MLSVITILNQDLAAFVCLEICSEHRYSNQKISRYFKADSLSLKVLGMKPTDASFETINLSTLTDLCILF